MSQYLLFWSAEQIRTDQTVQARVSLILKEPRQSVSEPAEQNRLLEGNVQLETPNHEWLLNCIDLPFPKDAEKKLSNCIKWYF